MILKNGNVIHENTEVQIIMRPPPATTFKALGVNPGAFALSGFAPARASMPINAQGVRRNSYPIANIPMCMTNQGFKHSIERSYSESIFIIVNITLFDFYRI